LLDTYPLGEILGLNPWLSVGCNICIGVHKPDTFIEDVVMLLELRAVLW
jgi:hypothetical protein